MGLFGRLFGCTGDSCANPTNVVSPEKVAPAPPEPEPATETEPPTDYKLFAKVDIADYIGYTENTAENVFKDEIEELNINNEVTSIMISPIYRDNIFVIILLITYDPNKTAPPLQKIGLWQLVVDLLSGKKVLTDVWSNRYNNKKTS